MEISLGFLVALVLILFPGLIFRRLYFYGEFSKEFKAGYNLVSLLALSSIPGILILITSYISYDFIFVNIDLGEIIDNLKDLQSPVFRHSKSEQTPISTLISSKVAPFIAYQYLISILFGTLSGRLIRISRLDTRFKLFRFKNYWFYLLNGQHTDLKKLKHLKERNRKHLFTKADILIDSSSKNHLYSGIVVDYELNDNDCNSLSKIMLQNAERYSVRGGQRVSVEIPGTLLVVDCRTMKNINLTYIYEDTRDILQSKIPNRIEIIFSILIISLIPVFIFKAEGIEWALYTSYFDQKWYVKLVAYFSTIQTLSLLNPFIKVNDEYRKTTLKRFFGKVIWIILMLGLLWILK